MGNDFLYITLGNTDTDDEECADECEDWMHDNDTSGKTFDEFEADAEELLTNVQANIAHLFIKKTCRMILRGGALTIRGARKDLAAIAIHLKKTRENSVIIMRSWAMTR